MKSAHLALVSILTIPLLAGATACNKPPEPQPDRPATTSTTTAMAAPTAPDAPGMGNAHSSPHAGGSPHGGATGPASPTGAGSGGAAAGPDDIAYDAPSTWVTAPNPNTMRKATFKIPKAGGEPEDAELSISSAAGGVEANIKRWEGQFGPEAKAKTEPRNPNGLKVTMVEIKGKMAGGGMMGTPAAPAKDHQMLLGAVVDAGDRQHFFKMVGGEKTVTAAKKDFDKLVSSFRAK